MSAAARNRTGTVAPAFERLDADDLPGLLGLERHGFGPGERWSADSWRAELAGPGRLCLGLRGGDGLVAAGIIGVLFEDAELLRIVVAPPARGRRVATGLLAGLMAAAAGRGAERMLLDVRRDNGAALALYGRAGFIRIAVRENYYGPGADALVLEAAVRPRGSAAGAAEGGRP
ncbi:GNAT family N-acetyltransferase [uncultured Propionibacterium sp.]|uniref:GNAT family N-acetyltransferase n=1 Tax=uncultured Propionibacterium sp. TaxID=218066 RepID=UPI00292D101A|nr:GNAT family N-acetyltransferase [uncultured Propionibacterium sp.]